MQRSACRVSTMYERYVVMCGERVGELGPVKCLGLGNQHTSRTEITVNLSKFRTLVLSLLV